MDTKFIWKGSSHLQSVENNQSVKCRSRSSSHSVCLKSVHRTTTMQSLTPMLGPKLKFYSFPLTRPTLKKGPTQKFYFNFQSRIFFKISLQPERIVQCNQCYLSKLFVYLILLPITELYSKTCLEQPLKDIRKGR